MQSIISILNFYATDLSFKTRARYVFITAALNVTSSGYCITCSYIVIVLGIHKMYVGM